MDKPNNQPQKQCPCGGKCTCGCGTSGKSCCGFTCPITGFRFGFNKKIALGTAATTIWFTLADYIWHTQVLTAGYQQTANLWRPMADIPTYAWHTAGATVLLAFVFTYMFSKGYRGTGWQEGLRYGLLITALFASFNIMLYAVMPISQQLASMWIAGDAIKFTLAALLLARLCKKGCC